MYTEEPKRTINWGSILKKGLIILLIVAIILLIIWLFTGNSSNAINVDYEKTNENININEDDNQGFDESAYSEIFITNYSYYHDTAKDYFLINEIPTNGNAIRYSIQDLINKNVLLKVRYGNGTCDLDSSYVAVTNEDNTYTMTTYLVCGSESVKTSERLACSLLCENCSEKLEYQYKQAYKAKQTIYSCPAGYTKSGSGANTKCTKGSNSVVAPTKQVTYSCPAGYTKSGSGANTKCTKTTSSSVNPTVTTTYSCPAGYVKTGSGANTKCTKTSSESVNASVRYTYSCPAGYTKSGSGANTTCSKTESTNPTVTTTYSCSQGTLVNTKYCRIYSSNSYYQSYETYHGATYNGCTYSGSYTAPCSNYTGCTKTYYKYYCTSTTYHDVAATETKTYSCPAGYNQSGSGANTTCTRTVTTNPTTSTTYSCPAGYNQSGSGANTKCTRTVTVNPTKTSEYYCNSGYVLSGNKCYKTTNVTANPTVTTTYSCPAGYTKSGSGANTTCTSNGSSEVNPNKTTTYSCPAGYSKSGIGESATCVKNSSTSTKPTVTTKTVTKYRYKWSTETSLEGWIRTGLTRKVKAN